MSRKRETLFSYFGGKYRQLGNILPILEKIPRKFYIEPFGGSGLVLYNKPVDDYEIYNDISGELCNLFRVLRTNSSELEDLASITPNSARFFEEFVSIRRAFGNDELLGKLQKKYQFDGYDLPTISAFATFYCLNTSFGGQGWTYGRNYAAKHNSLPNKTELLKPFSQRFKNVVIENMDGSELIRKYGKEHVLFYVDPPYNTKSTLGKYNAHFGKEETVKLIDTIQTAPSSFVVSCYDNEYYQELLNHGFEQHNFSAFCGVCHNVKSRKHCVETIYVKLSEWAKNQIEKNNVGNNLLTETTEQTNDQ